MVCTMLNFLGKEKTAILKYNVSGEGLENLKGLFYNDPLPSITNQPLSK